MRCSLVSWERSPFRTLEQRPVGAERAERAFTAKCSGELRKQSAPGQGIEVSPSPGRC